MASRKMHLDGKPTGLSPADLPLFAEPVAYLTETVAGMGSPRPGAPGPEDWRSRIHGAGSTLQGCPG